MEYSTCKDLVVWKPPPHCEVILNTRASYRSYLSTLQQLMGYDPHYDYGRFMAELGEVITCVLCREAEMESNCTAVAEHHRRMLPSSIAGTDAITLMGLKFQHLCYHCFQQAKYARLYNAQGYLPFYYKSWHVGCLVLGHMVY